MLKLMAPLMSPVIILSQDVLLQLISMHFQPTIERPLVGPEILIKCPMNCSREFTSKYDYLRHLKSHATTAQIRQNNREIKLNKCKKCGMVFKEGYHLLNHMKKVHKQKK